MESLGPNSRQAGLTERACRSPTRLTNVSASSRAVFNECSEARGLQWFKRGSLQGPYGAFPLHGTVRFGTARYGTVRLSSGRFAFPPQFSTAIEWAGLFTRRYNCAASTAVTSS